MTEPGAVPASPRRTVRVAVALVAGQAALCAVIGWLTFGPSPAPSRPSAAVDPPVAPRLVMPSISLAPPRTSAPPTTRATSSPAAATAARFTRPPRPPAPPKRSERPPATEEPPATMSSPVTTAPSGPSVVPPPDPAASPLPSTTGDVQTPVVEGEPCEPEGAHGRTVDDVALRCVRGEDGRTVWQINSER